MEISLTSRQDTICWIYEQEIKDFYLLLDHGLDIQTMISLCFKNGDSIIKKLENGISLNESFCFKNKNFENTFRFFSSFLPVKQSIYSTFQFMDDSYGFIKKCLKQLIYPSFIFLFCFFMIYFLSESILPFMDSFTSDNRLSFFIYLLKYIYTFILLFLLFLIVSFLILYKNHSLTFLFQKISLFRKMLTHQFCIIFINLLKAGIDTSTILSYMEKIKSHYLNHLIVKPLFEGLQKGHTLETIIKKNSYMDKHFLHFYTIGIQNNNLIEVLEIYINQTKNQMETYTKKFSVYVQIFSYTSVGLIAILVYQIMFYPLNMLSGI